MVNKINKKHVPYLLIALVVVSFILCYLPFILNNKSFLWRPDGVVQHYNFMVYMGKEKLLFNLGGIDLVGALGTDSLVNYIYYGLFDPFTLLFYILPSSWSVFTYVLMVILKMMTCCATMYLYLRYKGCSPTTSTIFGIAYMLSGYGVAMLPRHPILAGGMMYLPLLVMGLEKVMDGKRPYLFFVSNVLLLCSNFYMFFMCAIFTAIYAICYYIDRHKKEKFFTKDLFIKAGKVILVYILTVLLCAVAILPLVYGYTHGARGVSKGIMMPLIDNYFQMLLGIILPFWGESFFVTGIGIVVLLLIIYFLMFGKNKTYRFVLLILIVGLCIPVFSYVMNAFAYVSGRWLYLLLFVCMVASAITVESMKKKSWTEKEVGKLVKGAIIFTIIFVTVMGLVNFANVFADNTHNAIQALVYLTLIAIAVTLIWLLTTIRCRVGKKFTKFFSARNLQIAVLVFAIAGGMGCNWYYCNQFQQANKVEECLTSQTLQKASKLSSTTERVENLVDSCSAGLSYQRSNYGLYNGFSDTAYYNTMSNGSIYQYLKSLGMDGPRHTLGMGTLQGMLAPNAIWSTKYMITDTLVPYGYTQVEDTLYQNDHALPFGFVYNATMSEDYYYSLPLEERASAMLQACVTDTTNNFVYQRRMKRLVYQYSLYNVSIAGNYIKAQDNSKIKLTVPATTGELVLVIKDLNYHFNPSGLEGLIKTEDAVTFTIYNDQASYTQSIYKKGHQMYSGVQDYIYNLGCTDEDMTVTIQLPKGEYTYEDIAIYQYDLDGYQQDIDAIQYAMTDVEIDSNYLTGSITSDGGMLFLSLPYSDGWTAYVDGVKTTIKKANIGFMGLEITSGTHTIRLEYSTPGYKVGVVLSVVGVVGVVGYVIYYEYTRRRKNEKDRTTTSDTQA